MNKFESNNNNGLDDNLTNPPPFNDGGFANSSTDNNTSGDGFSDSPSNNVHSSPWGQWDKNYRQPPPPASKASHGKIVALVVALIMAITGFILAAIVGVSLFFGGAEGASFIFYGVGFAMGLVAVILAGRNIGVKKGLSIPALILGILAVTNGLLNAACGGCLMM